jgi:hypothetical protein
MDLREQVRSDLNTAYRENDYDFSKMSTVQVCNDLLEYSADLEGYDAGQIFDFVKEWLDENYPPQSAEV